MYSPSSNETLTPVTVQFVLFAISTGGSISFSSYLLLAMSETAPDGTRSSQDGSWLNRGIAVVAVSAVCLIHAFAPRFGVWLSNGLGAFKLILLALVVFTGFAALAGRSVEPSPGNFSSFDGPGSASPGKEDSTGTAAGYALALLQVLYSYSGWENANYVRILYTRDSRDSRGITVLTDALGPD
jgi:phosphatidylinositol 4-kinase